MPITPQLVTAYSLCPRKAYLLMRGAPMPPPHEYLAVLDHGRAKTKARFLASCQATTLNKEEIVVDATFSAGGLEATADVMIRRQSSGPKPRHYYEPHLFIGSNAAANEHKVAVAFLCKAIGEASESILPTGAIVTKSGKVVRINVANIDAALSPILSSLRAWASDLPPEPPHVVLNDHCPLCLSLGALSRPLMGGSKPAR